MQANETTAIFVPREIRYCNFFAQYELKNKKIIFFLAVLESANSSNFYIGNISVALNCSRYSKNLPNQPIFLFTLLLLGDQLTLHLAHFTLERNLSIGEGSLPIRLISSLTGLIMTKKKICRYWCVLYYKIQTNQTGDQPHRDTSPYSVCSLNLN